MDKNKIDLVQIFDSLKEEIYVISKLNDKFPAYEPGHDIDILCANIESFSKKVLESLNKYVEEGTSVKVNEKEFGHVQVDVFFKENELEIKFDLYQNLPEYSKVNVNNALFYSILEGREKKNIQDCLVYVPSKLDDLILRYLEYIEYFSQNPDKIKHLNYISEEVEKNSDSKKFLEKLHLYISFKALPIPRDSYFGYTLTSDVEKKFEEQSSQLKEIKNTLDNYLKHQTELEKNLFRIQHQLDNVDKRVQFVANSRGFKFSYYLFHPLQFFKRIIKKVI
jgi:hypothetical protein